MLDTLILIFTDYGYFAVFGMLLLCGFGLPVPEDITLVAGGVITGLACPMSDHFWSSLAACHQVHLMFAVSMAGVLIGDLTMLTFGRILGVNITKYRWFRRILPEKRFRMVKDKVTKYGAWIVFAARFMPGLRSPIFVMTGITRRVSYAKFVMIDGTAALISVPIWTYLGFWGSQQRHLLLEWVKKGQTGSFILLGIIVTVFAARVYLKYRKKNNRV
jgi:membrane protein DedA with SNARE-associated domain